MKELLCHFALPLTCGMAVIKVSDMSGKSLLCFTATICKMRVTFTSHWNVMKNSNCTVIWVWNVLWHILLRWEKSCYIQIFCPTQRSLYKASWFLPQALTDGIVSQQDQFFLQSESPDVETVACLSCTFHLHQNVSKVTRNVSVSVHRHTAMAHHKSARAWSNGQAFSMSNLAQSRKILHSILWIFRMGASTPCAKLITQTRSPL